MVSYDWPHVPTFVTGAILNPESIVRLAVEVDPSSSGRLIQDEYWAMIKTALEAAIKQI